MFQQKSSRRIITVGRHCLYMNCLFVSAKGAGRVTMGGCGDQASAAGGRLFRPGVHRRAGNGCKYSVTLIMLVANLANTR